METEKEKILITGVEQEDFLRIRSYVKDNFPGTDVSIVKSDSLAVTLTIEKNPDIIMIGSVWHETDPIHFCQSIRKNQLLHDVPVIFILPPNSESGFRLKASRCGADAFLYSPFDGVDIDMLLRNMLKIRKAQISAKKEEGMEGSILRKNSRQDAEDGKRIQQHLSDLQNEVKNREKSDAALTVSEEKFKSYIENAPYGVFIVDKEGKYIDINAAAETLTGYTRDEIIGRHILDYIFPEDLPLAEKHFRTVVEKDEATADIRFIRKDGDIRYSTVKAVKLSENRFLGFKSDITESKNHEQNLKESQDRFKSLFDYNPDGIFVWEHYNDDFILSMVNKTAIKNTNNHASDYVGLKASDIYKDMPIMVEKLNECFATRKTIEFEQYYQTRYSGDYVWVFFKFAFVEPDTVLLFSETITQRKEAEQSLKESEEKFRHLAENTSDGIIAFDAQNQVSYVSPSYLSQFGYTADKALKRNQDAIFELVHPDDRDVLFAHIFQAIGQKKNDLIYTYRVKNGKGQFIWREDHAKFKYDEQGNYEGANVICRDITERKLAEKARHDIEIAKQTIKFKQNFLANMSHEIRTPLTGVMGMIEALEHTKLSKKQQDFVNTIKLSGENLKVIIDQVLDYSKIEAGKVTIKPKVFEFRSLAETAKMLYKNNIKKGVEMVVRIDEKIPAFISADKHRLSQIVNNLVSNAVKFTPKGSVEIRASLVEVRNETNDVTIKMEVRDTGLGIPEAMQKNLFLPFSQIEDKDTVYHEGTGLGLSICKQLVEMMDGDIGMVSKLSGGSTFWFTFHAHKAEIPSQEKPTLSESVAPEHLRILFAEDKIVNQKVVKLMLHSLGHHVTIACNGKQAVKMYEPHKFDLILMDIQMPVMDGVAATQYLKEKYKYLPPVVGLSANAFEGDREKYMALGMDEYLTKPVKKDDFEVLIGKLFQQHPNPQSG